jgi:hypothetical protein
MDASVLDLTEREKLVVLHNLWLERAREAQESMERVVLNRCAAELRKALYGL